ncbi:MAG TPA: hypothetical protein VG675_02590 [Bryobacteraceae bacterium]|nr:hypothetical protein [Bryobacteraceae bacterium]
MNTKACQFCGKPLSRIRVGGDVDFCSREHRNQYRLRQGMDRLLEANKVASLMRRRENLKSISADLLLSGSETATRGFYSAKLITPSQRGGKMAAIPMHIGRGAPPTNGHMLAPGPRRSAAEPSRRIAEGGPAGFASSLHRLRPVPPPVGRPDLQVRLLPAETVDLQGRASRTRVVRRELRAPRRDSEPLLNFPRIEKRLLESFRTAAIDRKRSARGFHLLPRSGKAERIWSSTGFSEPPRAIRPLRTSHAFSGALTSAQRMRTLSPRKRTIAGIPILYSLELGTPALWYPESRGKKKLSGLSTCGAIGRPPVSFGPATRVPRGWDSQPMDHTGVFLPAHGTPPGLVNGFTQRSPVLEINLPLKIQSASRHALAPFAPQDSLIGYTQIALRGTVSGSITDSRRSSTRSGISEIAGMPMLRLEENFDGGLGRWAGNTESWKLDAAGVRTGALALFGPSLEMDDYELEFLAKIESRSVSWVFRALNFSNYYMATLAALEGGGHELRRRAVVGGAEEAEQHIPVQAKIRSKAAITVRMQVSGSRFVTSVDGEVVDEWTDERMETGGIGFVAEPNNPARLYWVRLSSPGQDDVVAAAGRVIPGRTAGMEQQ